MSLFDFESSTDEFLENLPYKNHFNSEKSSENDERHYLCRSPNSSKISQITHSQTYFYENEHFDNIFDPFTCPQYQQTENEASMEKKQEEINNDSPNSNRNIDKFNKTNNLNPNFQEEDIPKDRFYNYSEPIKIPEESPYSENIKKSEELKIHIIKFNMTLCNKHELDYAKMCSLEDDQEIESIVSTEMFIYENQHSVNKYRDFSTDYLINQDLIDEIIVIEELKEEEKKYSYDDPNSNNENNNLNPNIQEDEILKAKLYNSSDLITEQPSKNFKKSEELSMHIIKFDEEFCKINGLNFEKMCWIEKNEQSSESCISTERSTADFLTSNDDLKEPEKK